MLDIILVGHYQDMALIADERRAFHARLLKGVLTIDDEGVPSNADGDSDRSVRIALNIAHQLEAETGIRLAGQTSGSEFETCTAEFLERTFLRLPHIGPGLWEVRKVGRTQTIADFGQYAWLDDIEAAIQDHPGLAALLGDYTIRPDVIVVRKPLCDDSALGTLVDDSVCQRAALLERNGGKPILHANISSKWTMRSDRNQNCRTESQTLITRRTGRVPHIVVTTGEPLPSRLLSLARGTGHIDCMYHFALPELERAVKDESSEVQKQLNSMIVGKRLKDISDLPFDLVM